MNDTFHMATAKWLKATQLGRKAAKKGNWKIAEHHFRKAVLLSIKLDLVNHIYSMVDRALALRMLNRLVESRQVASAAHALTLRHLNANQPDFHVLLDLIDVVGTTDSELLS